MNDNNDDIREEAIAQLSEQHGVDEDQLEAELEELLSEEQEKGVDDPVRRAIRRLSLEYKGSQMGSYREMKGVVLGFSDPINTSARQIERAEKYVSEKGPGAARKRGLVRPVPEDKELPEWAATITVEVDGEERPAAVVDANENSPTQGEILPREDYIRYAHGAVRRGDEYVMFSGVLDADGGVPPEPPLFEAVEFEASISGDGDGENVSLRFRGGEPFRPVDGPSGAEVFEQVVEPVGLEKVDADEYGRDDLIVTKGSVSYMELAPGEDQSRRLTVVDPFDFGSEGGVTVWLPDHHEVNYAEQSDVYVVGRVSPSSSPEYRDSINAVGVLVDPAFKVDRDQVDSFSGDEDADESGSGGDWDGDPGESGADGDDGGEDDRPAEEAAAVAGGAATDGGDGDDEEHGDFETDEADQEWNW